MLIDIDAFRKEHRINEHCEDCERNARECQYNDFSMMDFCGWLDDAPTVDAVPVKHGRWEREDNVYDDLTYICSACHEPWTLIDGTPLDNNMHYCPNCGAKMDLEEQDAKKET